MQSPRPTQVSMEIQMLHASLDKIKLNNQDSAGVKNFIVLGWVVRKPVNVNPGVDCSIIFFLFKNVSRL